ncbi:hypothetical protein PORUE0001_1418 [Porphyromonas uenonis 60-3]|uniref:Uncharacterized protein n=4 Tax=Porphyromonas uenonis TaxID=281920 RepID=C2MDY6_9PORP|nr:hypothetical protein PORUE0001_1418 [Porphyromonas uenonis 60-3]
MRDLASGCLLAFFFRIHYTAVLTDQLDHLQTAPYKQSSKPYSIMTNLQRILAALTAIVCVTLAMNSCKPKSEPTTTTEVLQVKDFPYLKKESKMSTYSFGEIEAYEKQLGLRKLTKKTDTSLIYEAINPKKVNLTYVCYKIIPRDESKSGAFARADRFTMDMCEQPELRSYFELNGFTYEGSDQNASEKFVNKDLAVRLTLSSTTPGVGLTFTDAPDLYHKKTTPGDPNFQALYLPLLDVFGQKISQDSPIIDREQKTHPDCEIEFVKANVDKGYKHDAIVVNMPFITKLKPADRSKPRVRSYSYESKSGSTIELISYLFTQEWMKANIPGTDPLIKDFMTKNGFTYQGMEKVSIYDIEADLYQYYNDQLKVYFEYSLVGGAFPTAMGVYTKTPTVEF